MINTSFNRKGKPIVHTKENALKAARNMKLDGAVLNGEVVAKFF
ncbi:MAG: carbamoyltransferase C-terminal domain-containing protein [Tangfeifania sp.]